MSEPAVVIDHLTRRFDSFTAVDDVSLTVQRGETFGFLGANGAGKTTTIRMMTGLLLPTSGTGKVAGRDINTESEQVKRSIGYMSQKFSLYPDMTGQENMRFYGAAYGMAGKQVNRRIEQLTDRLDLAEFISRRSGSLPTGWRQRLALAVALLHEPSILFLDEPTSGVDPVFRRHFWEILYELASEGVTVFITTHYMDEAEYCDRISIMHRGRIIEMGKPFKIVEKHDREDLEDAFVYLISQQGDGNA